uniref:sensor histidine kinase n=1 Tax=Tetragenococcus halophilus TaxID=51669 RepID=UPI0024E09F64|nr:HAMP domain-containing sensor histidine kinase [Tetragenococcus halophilus]
MAKHATLRRIITKMSLLELFFSVFVLLALIFAFNLSIQLDFIYPANHAERQLTTLEKNFFNGKLTEEDIPFYYDYQFIENGHRSQTIPEKFAPLIKEAKRNGYSQTDSFIATKIFTSYEQGDRELVLSYRLMATFVSEKLDRLLPPPEILYAVTFLLLWISGFLLIIRHYVGVIHSELAKVNQTNEEIKQMNLDYPRASSRLKETQEILDSLDNMSKQLKQALKKQWSSQQKQKELVQSVTHDIRTPITLIKGNLELLEETQFSTEQQEQLADLKNGVKRLEQYVEQLKAISGLIEEDVDKQAIDQALLEEWRDLLADLAKTNHMKFEIVKQDKSDLTVAKKQLTNALQNVLLNSVEHSLPDTCLTVSFADHSNEYRITVEDQGSGFNEQALRKANQRSFSTKTDASNEHYGLGLSIVEEILTLHNGKLEFENIINAGKVEGARVIMHLYKNSE